MRVKVNKSYYLPNFGGEIFLLKHDHLYVQCLQHWFSTLLKRIIAFCSCCWSSGNSHRCSVYPQCIHSSHCTLYKLKTPSLT